MFDDAGAGRGWNWRKPAILVGLACIVGLGLRLLLLGSKSLWFDEAFSVRAAASPVDLLWTGSVDRNLPPLYFILLHYWLPLGTSEFALRLSSALLGAAAIPALYALARRRASPGVAVSAAWLAALSPLLVWYSQELRNYSLLTLLGLLIGLAVVGLFTRMHAGWWLLLVAAMTVALYTHYLAVVLAFAQIFLVGVLIAQGRLRRAAVPLWLASFPATLLLYWPWLRLPTPSTFLRSALAGGFLPVTLTASTFNLPIEEARTLIFGASLIAGVVLLLAAYPILRLPPATWERWRRAPGLRTTLLLLVLAATVISVIPRVYTIKKIVVSLWPYFLLVVAWFWPWQAAYRRALALVLAASLTGALINVAIIPKDPWRDVAQYLQESRQPDDGLWIQPYYHAIALDYYARGALPSVRPDVAGAPSSLAGQAAEYPRLWYVYGVRDVTAADPQQVVVNWLEQNMQRVESRDWFGIRVILYARLE